MWNAVIVGGGNEYIAFYCSKLKRNKKVMHVTLSPMEKDSNESNDSPNSIAFVASLTTSPKTKPKNQFGS